MMELIGEVPNSHKFPKTPNKIELTPELTATIIGDMVNGIRYNTNAQFIKQCNRLKVMLVMDTEVARQDTQDAIRIMYDRYGHTFIEWAKGIPEIVAYNNKRQTKQ